MNEELFFEMLADIDDTYILEAREDELLTPPVISVASARRAKMIHIVLPAALGIASLILVIAGLSLAVRFGKDPNKTPTGASIIEQNTVVKDTTAEETRAGLPTEATGADETTYETASEQATEMTVEDTTAEETTAAGLSIPSIPSDKTIVLTGTPITDDDAAAYFAEKKGYFMALITSSGLPSDNIHFSTQGYGHVRYEGKAGESLTIDQSFRDYLVYNGDELIAIVTLFRGSDYNEIYDTFGYGGEWLPDFSRFLEAHKGEKLLFLYAGHVELVLAPDGSVMNPQGLDQDTVALYFEGVAYPYPLFYHEAATYTP